MDMDTLAVAVAVVKNIPGTAAARAEDAATRAEEAAESVESATVAETKAYLNIS